VEISSPTSGPHAQKHPRNKGMELQLKVIEGLTVNRSAAEELSRKRIKPLGYCEPFSAWI
jgi:hypothetical protein